VAVPIEGRKLDRARQAARGVEVVRSHRRDIDALRGAAAVLLSEHSQRWYEIQRQRTPRNIREVEAEGVAFILCAFFGLPGLDESRGYLQSWLGEGAPPSAWHNGSSGQQDPCRRASRGAGGGRMSAPHGG
jgi:hypothetical protein